MENEQNTPQTENTEQQVQEQPATTYTQEQVDSMITKAVTDALYPCTPVSRCMPCQIRLYQAVHARK